MVTPRLAHSLIRLRNDIDRLAPNRSRISDGWIGDAAHRNRASRHNPNRWGVVTAWDGTDDPGRGCPIHELAERIRRDPHPELAYIISNRRIAGRITGWRWHRYLGSNPHYRHAHFGVGWGPDSDPRPPYDDGRTSWSIWEEDEMTDEDIERIAKAVVKEWITRRVTIWGSDDKMPLANILKDVHSDTKSIKRTLEENA